MPPRSQWSEAGADDGNAFAEQIAVHGGMVTRESAIVQASEVMGGRSRLAPACPRCGYDLRGEASQWIDACPLEGHCVECGLHFQWARVLLEDRMPRWFTERQVGLRFRSVRTWMRSLLPWHFWRQIRITMPVRRRLWLYPLQLLVLLSLVMVSMAVVRAVAGIPSRTPIRASAEAASIAAIVVMPWSGETVDITLDKLYCQFFPASAGPFPSRKFEFLRARLPPPRFHLERLWRPVMPLVEAMIVTTMATVAAFALLPVVRARARVRWPHVWRAGVYGLGLIAAGVLAIWLIETASFLLFGDATTQWSPRRIWAATPLSLSALRLAPVAFLIWWLAVSRHYLKLDRPVAVALAVTTVGALSGLTVHAYRNAATLHQLIPLPWWE